MTLHVLIKEAFGQNTSLLSRTEMEKGASSRRYFRVILSSNGADTPQNVVQMVLPYDAMKSDEASHDDDFDELPFVNVQRHMAAAGLPVPRIFLDATDRGHLLLEDLGQVTLNANLKSKSIEEVEDWYNATVDLLSTMHDAMWPVPNACFAANRYFGYELLRWELDHFREWGVEKRLGITLESKIRQQMDAVFDRYAAEIDALPKGFVHRDYQSRNLMVTADAPNPSHLSIIDFQDALTGPRTYDLVALLNDSYVDLPFDMQQRLIARYAQNRGLSASEIEHEFNLITIQRKLKDGGRFVFIDQVKGDPSFLPFVKKSYSRVKSALLRISGHDKLKALLRQVDPENF
ncbi:MAG: phosphotransferase [Deltaproteobacteria bacterium]|nr:phosphotransferase [Deltaproteobacteria bacterium]